MTRPAGSAPPTAPPVGRIGQNKILFAATVARRPAALLAAPIATLIGSPRSGPFHHLDHDPDAGRRQITKWMDGKNTDLPGMEIGQDRQNRAGLQAGPHKRLQNHRDAGPFEHHPKHRLQGVQGRRPLKSEQAFFAGSPMGNLPAFPLMGDIWPCFDNIAVIHNCYRQPQTGQQ